MWYPEPLHGIRTIAARKIAPRLGLGFGLGLVLEIGLGGQFSSGAIVLEPSTSVILTSTALLLHRKERVNFGRKTLFILRLYLIMPTQQQRHGT